MADDAVPMNDLSEYIAAHPPKGFRPVPSFSVAGNMLSVYFEDDPGFAETLNPQVTVIRAFSDRRIVGVKLFEVPELIAEAIRTHGEGAAG